MIKTTQKLTKCPECGKDGCIIKKYDEWDGFPFWYCILCFAEFEIDDKRILEQDPEGELTRKQQKKQ